ncbi:MAG: integrase [Coprococcus sp.]|nr:integrase [Coprococcus sp.]
MIFLLFVCGHISEIGVTLNTYTHLGLEDAAEEMKRMETLEKARKEMYGGEKEKPMKQNMFKVV